MYLYALYESDYRTILAEETADSKYYDSRSLRDVGVKSRLDSSVNKSRIMGALSRPKASSSSSSSSQSTGYRIVVSNLQANVTQEDIKVQYNNLFFKLLALVSIKISIKIAFYRNYSKT